MAFSTKLASRGLCRNYQKKTSANVVVQSRLSWLSTNYLKGISNEAPGSSVTSFTNAISEGDIFMYSGSAQLISFEVDSISKEINCAEHEYMNMSPSLIALATPLTPGRVC